MDPARRPAKKRRRRYVVDAAADEADDEARRAFQDLMAGSQVLSGVCGALVCF